MPWTIVLYLGMDCYQCLLRKWYLSRDNTIFEYSSLIFLDYLLSVLYCGLIYGSYIWSIIIFSGKEKIKENYELCVQLIIKAS